MKASAHQLEKNSRKRPKKKAKKGVKENRIKEHHPGLHYEMGCLTKEWRGLVGGRGDAKLNRGAAKSGDQGPKKDELNRVERRKAACMARSRRPVAASEKKER